MLDDVERGRFLIEPTRESATPALVRLLHVELHERAGQLFLFPGRRRLAGAKAHDDVLPAHRLTGAKRDVLNDAVALVENAEDRDAPGHRRDAALPVRRRGSLATTARRRVLLRLVLAARHERERGKQRCGSGGLHAYSGIQGS
jgi:hypothetical protein